MNDVTTPDDRQAETTVSRLEYRLLDPLRGIAALAVVVCHVVGAFAVYRQEVWESLAVRLAANGYLGVEVFFVISGYCIAAAGVSHLRRGQTVTRFIGARVRRIYPAYVATLALLIGLVLLNAAGAPGLDFLRSMPGLNAGPPSLKTAVINFTLLQVPTHAPTLMPVSWTLCYEVAFYAVCGMVLFVCGRRGSAAFLTVLHGITVACLVGWVFLPGRLVFPFDLWPQFGLGAILLDLVLRPGNRWTRTVAATAVVLMMTAARQPTLIGVGHHDIRKSVGVCVVIFLGLLVCRRWDDRLMRGPVSAALAWVGVMSYSLYLTHHALVLWLVHLCRGALASPSLLVAMTIVFTGLAIVLGRGVFLLVERPLMKKRTSNVAPPLLSEPAVAAAAAAPAAGV